MEEAPDLRVIVTCPHVAEAVGIRLDTERTVVSERCIVAGLPPCFQSVGIVIKPVEHSFAIRSGQDNRAAFPIKVVSDGDVGLVDLVKQTEAVDKPGLFAARLFANKCAGE